MQNSTCSFLGRAHYNEHGRDTQETNNESGKADVHPCPAVQKELACPPEILLYA